MRHSTKHWLMLLGRLTGHTCNSPLKFRNAAGKGFEFMGCVISCQHLCTQHETTVSPDFTTEQQQHHAFECCTLDSQADDTGQHTSKQTNLYRHFCELTHINMLVLSSCASCSNSNLSPTPNTLTAPM